MTDATKDIIKAAKQGDLARIQVLLSADPALIAARDKDGSTPLHCAVWKGQERVVAFLLKAGADVNSRNQNEHWGTTPLHAAAHADHASIALLLIEHEADMTALDPEGRSPLDHTKFHDAKRTAKVLAKHLGEET